MYRATPKAVSKAKRRLPHSDSSFGAGADLGGAVGVAMELDVGSTLYSPPDHRKLPRPKPRRERRRNLCELVNPPVSPAFQFLFVKSSHRARLAPPVAIFLPYAAVCAPGLQFW